MPKAFHAVLLLASGFMIFTVSTTAYAAEAIVRFTRNGQDALIIGEVISKDGDSIAVEPVYYVVSPSSMTPIKEQLHYNSAVIVDMVNTKYYYDSLDVGDYIIASLDKDGDYFKVMWGLYKIDSLDYKTLNVYGGNSDDNEYIKNFLNNGIEYNEQNRADIDELIAIDDFANVKAIIYPVIKEMHGQAHDTSAVLGDIIGFAIVPVFIVCGISLFAIRRTMRNQRP